MSNSKEFVCDFCDRSASRMVIQVTACICESCVEESSKALEESKKAVVVHPGLVKRMTPKTGSIIAESLFEALARKPPANMVELQNWWRTEAYPATMEEITRKLENAEKSLTEERDGK